MTKINIQCILTYWLLNDQKKIRSSLTLKFTPKFGFCHTNSFKPVITAPVSSLKSVYYKSLFLKKKTKYRPLFLKILTKIWKYISEEGKAKNRITVSNRIVQKNQPGWWQVSSLFGSVQKYWRLDRI